MDSKIVILNSLFNSIEDKATKDALCEFLAEKLKVEPDTVRFKYFGKNIIPDSYRVKEQLINLTRKFISELKELEYEA